MALESPKESPGLKIRGVVSQGLAQIFLHRAGT